MIVFSKRGTAGGVASGMTGVCDRGSFAAYGMLMEWLQKSTAAPHPRLASVTRS